MMPQHSHATRILAAILFGLVALGFLGMTPAAAQVVLLVNGEPITAFDIEQRSKLIQLSSRKPPPRQEVIEALIEDKLKVQIGKRYGLEVPATEVDNAYANIGRRMRQSPEEFTKGLERTGIRADTLKSRLRADIAWGQIVRGKFANTLQVGEKDVLNIIGARKGEAEDFGFDYALRPILFLVPRGASDAVIETRKREAEALRARFAGCEEGLPFVRALRDVVVRDPIRRNSADLSPQLREVLDAIPVGKLTPPELTQGGIEVFALCGKEKTTSETPGKREARDEIFQQRFLEQGKRYLSELRKQAMIEYKN